MADLWNADENVYEKMRELVAKYHPDLALCDDEIAILFQEKAPKSAPLGKVAKASPILPLLSGKDWKFLITLPMETWSDLSDVKKVACLDRHLCACCAEESKDGGIKYSIQPPEVSFYKEELSRYGAWFTGNLKSNNADLVTELFGFDD